MKGNSPLFSSYSIRNAAAADISFMGNGARSDFAKNASRRKDVDPDGLFDVIAHGSNYEIEIANGNHYVLISPRQAAKLLKKQRAFKKSVGVRLLSCSTGAVPDGFAQHLANALGKPVFAPSKTLWCSPNGTMWVSSDKANTDRGQFIKFIPGGIKHGRK